MHLARGFLFYISNGNAQDFVQMKKQIIEDAYIFDRSKFLKDEGKELNKLHPVITHPLHLFILKQLNINPIIPKHYKLESNVACIETISKAEIDDYRDLYWTSMSVRSFVANFFNINDEDKTIEGQKPLLIFGKKEKLKKHFIESEHFNDNPKQKVAFLNGCIDYFQWLLEKKDDQHIQVLLNLVTKEKNNWEQLIEKPDKKPQKNTLKGKKLNLLERYEIAKQVFDIDNQIRTLHISEAEKDKLLSLILDCNTTNARHIMNGKYPGKIREELITEYIQTLKK